MASELVDTELQRLGQRTPTMDESDREEVGRAVRRVVDKLLHQPTVRAKELAARSGPVSYASALQELFGLEERLDGSILMIPNTHLENPLAQRILAGDFLPGSTVHVDYQDGEGFIFHA